MRKRRQCAAQASELGRFAYADPPYPGLSKRYYQGEPDYAGEVDHAPLIAGLEQRRERGELLGWALSTGAYALREILPLCPAGVRVCAWVKPHGVSPLTYGIHNASFLEERRRPIRWIAGQ